VKPEVTESQNACEDKGKAVIIFCENANIKPTMLVMKHSKSRSLPTYHHCGISGNIRPHCPQIHSQKPRINKQEPKKGKFGTRPSKIHHAPQQKRQDY
jgi:hypothetical protein